MTIAALFALALVSPVASAGHLNSVGSEDSPTHILFGECREVNGTVVDSETGEPLENITVAAVPGGAESLVNVYSHAHTDENGFYSLFVHNTGNYRIIAVDDRLIQDGDPMADELPAHAPKVHDQSVVVDDPDCEQEPAVRDFGLEPLAAPETTGDVELTLREIVATVPEVEGNPLEGQTIGLGTAGSCDTFEATTDPQGKARFEDLPRDQEYCVSFTHEDYEDNSTTLLLDSALAEVELNSTRTLRTVSGNVLDTHVDAGIPDVDLSLEHPLFCPGGSSSMPDTFECNATTDADGDYDVDVPWDEDDDYDLDFDLSTLPGYEGANATTVSVGPPSAGGSPGADFELDRTDAVIIGTVLERGDPVPLAAVCLQGITACTITSGTGEFALLVTWGDYTLSITHPDGTVHTDPISLPYDGLDFGLFDFDPIIEGISGTVRDATAGNVAIGGVGVEAFDEIDPVTAIPCGDTASDGSFFCPVSAGEYTLNVTTSLYQALSANVGPFTVNPEAETDAGNIDLDRLAVSVIEGTVHDLDAESELEGATVEILGSATGTTRSATTDAAGEYSFTDLPWDTYKVNATMAEYGLEESSGNEVGHENDTSDPFVVDLDLGRTLHDISGTVTDTDAGDAPIQGVTVNAVGQDVTASASVTTDSAGDYVFTGLPWGDYELEFDDSRYETATETTSIVPPDDTQDVDVSLDRLRSNITGFMLENLGTFEDPVPITDDTFAVDCIADETSGFSVAVTTNETHGNYTIEDLPWDTYVCTAVDVDEVFYEDQEVFILPAGDNLTDADFTLTRHMWLVHGVVRDLIDDSAVPDIRVCINNLNDLGSGPVCERTAGDGRFSQTVPYTEPVTGTPETNVVSIAVDSNDDYAGGVAVALIGPDLGHEDERTVHAVPQPAAPSAQPSLINGRVLDADAREDLGASGVLVNATHQDTCVGPQPEGLSGASGNYTLAVTCEGTWDLAFSHPAGLYQEAVLEDVEVDESPSVIFAPDVALERTTGNATVNVTDLLTLEGVEGANVTIQGIDTDTGPIWELTDENGNATFTGLPWGAYNATVDATHIEGVINETVTGFVVVPGENATAQAFILGQPPEAPECVGEGTQVCEAETDDGGFVLDNITVTDHTGEFIVMSPELGNLSTTSGDEFTPAPGPHNGTWTVIFQPDPNGPQPIELTATYTNTTSGETSTLEASNLLGNAAVGGTVVHSPIVWVFNLHSESTAACLPDPLGCDQDPTELANLRFYLPDSDDS